MLHFNTKFNETRKYLFILLVGLIIFNYSCTNSLVPVKKKKEKKTIHKLIQQYKSENWEKRLLAIKYISKLIFLQEIDISEDIFIQATYDIHLAIRIEAIRALAQFPTKKSKDRIEEIIIIVPDGNEKWYALKTLSYYRNPGSFEIFLRGLSSNDWLIREISIKGLLMIDNITIKYKLIPYILITLNDPVKSVRISTLDYLNIKDNRIYKSIIKIFNKEYKRKNTLFKSSLKALKGYKLDEKIRHVIINLLVHQDQEIRIFAFRVLKEDKLLRQINRN